MRDDGASGFRVYIAPDTESCRYGAKFYGFDRTSHGFLDQGPLEILITGSADAHGSLTCPLVMLSYLSFVATHA